ncbi:MAG: hypothetical protein ACLTMP_07345 [Eggerthella lenta]
MAPIVVTSPLSPAASSAKHREAPARHAQPAGGRLGGAERARRTPGVRAPRHHGVLVLLTRRDTADRRAYLHARDTFDRLLELRWCPS